MNDDECPGDWDHNEEDYVHCGDCTARDEFGEPLDECVHCQCCICTSCSYARFA